MRVQRGTSGSEQLRVMAGTSRRTKGRSSTTPSESEAGGAMLGTEPMYARPVPPPLPPAPGVEHREIQLPGVRLRVAEAGAGDPVLLLHGWPQHWGEGAEGGPPRA